MNNRQRYLHPLYYTYDIPIRLGLMRSRLRRTMIRLQMQTLPPTRPMLSCHHWTCPSLQRPWRAPTRSVFRPLHLVTCVCSIANDSLLLMQVRAFLCGASAEHLRGSVVASVDERGRASLRSLSLAQQLLDNPQEAHFLLLKRLLHLLFPCSYIIL